MAPSFLSKVTGGRRRRSVRRSKTSRKGRKSVRHSKKMRKSRRTRRHRGGSAGSHKVPSGATVTN